MLGAKRTIVEQLHTGLRARRWLVVLLGWSLVLLAGACGGAQPQSLKAREPLPMCNPSRELLLGGDFEGDTLDPAWVETGGAIRIGAQAGCTEPLAPLRRGQGALSTAVADGAMHEGAVTLRQRRTLSQLGIMPGTRVAASVFVSGTCQGPRAAHSVLRLRFLEGGEVIEELDASPMQGLSGAWQQQATGAIKVPPAADAVEVEFTATAPEGQPGAGLRLDDLSLAECQPTGTPLASWRTNGPTEVRGEPRGGGPRPPVRLPDRIVDPNTAISCTLECTGGDCQQATVYVAACDENQPEVCHAIEPAVRAGDGGNTYLVAVAADGRVELLRDNECTAVEESEDGLALDLVFVIDTTGSMARAISGVVHSIDAFVDLLADKGVDTRIGGIAFGDRAPLTTCAAPDAPFAPLTSVYGAGTMENPASFTRWLHNLSAAHCGDGGGDGPENALDAVEFVLGSHRPAPYRTPEFQFRPGALKVAVVITDVSQHQRGDGTEFAHFTRDEVIADLSGAAVVHAVSPNFSCMQTPFAGCLCDLDAAECDAGCDCDARCPTPGCPADKQIGICDHPMQQCDIDCAGYPGRVTCDKQPGVCDAHPLRADQPCVDDHDCRGGVPVGTPRARRCYRRDLGAEVDIAQLATATGGAFTPLSSSGHVDLTQLPLSGAITATERCQVTLPAHARRLRCVYLDGAGHQGEATINIERR